MGKRPHQEKLGGVLCKTMITDELVSRSGLTISPEVRDTTGHYQMFDDGGIEVQVGEFLYGMVRILQPNFILETGTYTGISSMYMGQALKDNKYGHITTLEISDYHRQRAMKLWEKVGVAVNCELIDAAKYEPKEQIDLLFLDSEPNIRWGELVKFYPHLNEGGYVFIHDVPLSLCQGNINPDHPEIKSWPFGDLPLEIKNWVKDGDLRPMHFPNPRGLLGFYKTKPDEYKWL